MFELNNFQTNGNQLYQFYDNFVKNKCVVYN